MAERRKKGTGTIRKRSDGRYEGRVIVGYDDEGNPRVKTVTSKLRRDVVQKMEAVRTENIIPLKDLKKDMPFGQWICRSSILSSSRAVGESDRISTARACPIAWFDTSMPSARVRWM